MEKEGQNQISDHDESFDNVGISDYLSMIREKKDKEYGLILAFINHSFKEFYIFPGEEDAIQVESYFRTDKNGLCAIDFINKWAKQGADICNYHNHPLRHAAVASFDDWVACCPEEQSEGLKNNWANCVDKYGKDLPDDFRYADWGVVTVNDFFSHNQFIMRGGNKDEEMNRLFKEMF